jgi:hypothetical protein
MLVDARCGVHGSASARLDAGDDYLVVVVAAREIDRIPLLDCTLKDDGNLLDQVTQFISELAHLSVLLFIGRLRALACFAIYTPVRTL